MAGFSLFSLFSVFFTLLCFQCLLPSKWKGEPLTVLLCVSSVLKLSEKHKSKHVINSSLNSLARSVRVNYCTCFFFTNLAAAQLSLYKKSACNNFPVRTTRSFDKYSYYKDTKNKRTCSELFHWYLFA